MAELMQPVDQATGDGTSLHDVSEKEPVRRIMWVFRRLNVGFAL